MARDDRQDGPSIALERRRRRRRLRAHRHHRNLVIAVLLLLVFAGSATALAMLSTKAVTLVGRCHLASMRPVNLGANTLLTTADGAQLGFIATSPNREPIPLSAMTRWLPKATVAIEDRRYWHHGALDTLGAGRSLVADVTAGRVVQGASTLTQQLVRNRYLGGERMTLSRKLTEACLAVQLYDRWPRRRILSTYLNTVFYGHHARGAQAAAWTYFSRPAAKLTLPQAALIAGLPQAPSRFDPLAFPRAARARRNEVLAAMLRAHDIGPYRYRAAVRSRLRLRPGDHYGGVGVPTFTDAARLALVQRFGAHRVKHGGLRVQTTLRPRLQHLAQHALDAWIRDPAGPSGALVAIDPHTGEVLAAASATPGVGPLRFDLATQSRRQAGSAFKTFTLTTALEQGVSLSSVWHGPPSLTIPDPRCDTGTVPWTVHNFADESSGTMTLLQGIAHSVNTIYAQVAVKVGPANIVRTAQQMGVQSPLVPVCAITLGPEGVSPLDMADAYATLASGGIHHAPVFVRSVRDASGSVLLRPPPQGNRVLSPAIADRVTYALSAVISGGTGTAANIGRPAAGKTGTAENSGDAWFCGYTPQLTACAWIGYPRSEAPMFSVDGFAPVVGGGVPARIWHDFMSAALAGQPVEPMPQAGTAALAPPRPAPRPAPAGAATPAPAGTPAPRTAAPRGTKRHG